MVRRVRPEPSRAPVDLQNLRELAFAATFGRLPGIQGFRFRASGGRPSFDDLRRNCHLLELTFPGRAAFRDLEEELAHAAACFSPALGAVGHPFPETEFRFTAPDGLDERWEANRGPPDSIQPMLETWGRVGRPLFAADDSGRVAAWRLERAALIGSLRALEGVDEVYFDEAAGRDQFTLRVSPGYGEDARTFQRRVAELSERVRKQVEGASNDLHPIRIAIATDRYGEKVDSVFESRPGNPAWRPPAPSRTAGDGFGGATARPAVDLAALLPRAEDGPYADELSRIAGNAQVMALLAKRRITRIDGGKVDPLVVQLHSGKQADHPVLDRKGSTLALAVIDTEGGEHPLSDVKHWSETFLREHFERAFGEIRQQLVALVQQSLSGT